MMRMLLLVCRMSLLLSKPFASAEIVALPHGIVLAGSGKRHVRFWGATVLGPPEREAFIRLGNVRVERSYSRPGIFGGSDDSDNDNDEQQQQGDEDADADAHPADDAQVAGLDDDGWFRSRRRSRGRSRGLLPQQQQRTAAASGSSIYDDGFDGVELTTEEEEHGSFATIIDIAVFRVPAHCAYAPVPEAADGGGGRPVDGCRWEDQGVGGVVSNDSYNNGTDSASLDVGAVNSAGVFWCCNARAVHAGACAHAPPHQQHRLIFTERFAGFRRAINVTSKGGGGVFLGNLEDDMDIRLPESGAWVVLFANCRGDDDDDDDDDDDGRWHDALLSGAVEFESAHGYLPGELVPCLRRDGAFAALYSCLLLWFACQMCDSAGTGTTLPVQGWILLAIGVAWIEAWLRTECYLDWNAAGVLDSYCPPAIVVMGAAKRSVVQCLVLMVSLGWGVTGDGRHLHCLARCDVILLAAAQFASGVGFGMAQVEYARFEQPRPFDAAATIAERAAAGINHDEGLISLAFLLWTAVALAGTIGALRSARQTRKLVRYRNLTVLLLGSYLCAAVAVAIAEAHADADARLVLWVEAASDAMYCSLLVGVSYLWRPSDRAPEHAYYQSPQLPIPPTDVGDDEYDGYELALVSHRPPQYEDDAAP
jgi:Lung seven transmembrane receptor